MVSHTIMSSVAGAPRHTTSTVFFVPFVPTVAMYRSSNSSWTKRLIREVFPTATSPTRHTFALRRFCPTTAGVGDKAYPSGADFCAVRTRGAPLRKLAWGRYRSPGDGDRLKSGPLPLEV